MKKLSTYLLLLSIFTSSTSFAQFTVTSTITDNCGENNIDDGSISLLVSGGTSPYTYNWSSFAAGQTSSTATGLTNYNYNVTITDNGGVDTIVSFFVPRLITISPMFFSMLSCSDTCDGFFIPQVTGGSTPYSYSWIDSNFDIISTADSLFNICENGVDELQVIGNQGCYSWIPLWVQGPQIIDDVVDITNVASCSDGSVTLYSYEGVAPYTYLWSNGSTTSTISGLSSGTYYATVTDSNGCADTASAVVSNVGSLISVTTSANSSNCSACDGDAAIVATGGASPYAYDWGSGSTTNASATGLCAGSFTVTTTDSNGCSTETTIVINSVSSLSGVTSTTDVLCNGSVDGSISVTASSGSTPYTYLWGGANETTQSVSGLSIGTYPCTITDNIGCTIIVNANINGPALLSSGITSSSNCAVGSGNIIYSATGGTPPYQYSIDSGATWSTSTTYTGLLANIYTCVVQDVNLCNVYNTISIDTALNVINTLYPINNCLSYGAVYTQVTNGIAPYYLTWNIDPLNGDSTSLFNYVSLGDYELTVTDAAGCSSSSSFSIDNGCGSNKISGYVFDDLDTDCISNNSNKMREKTIMATPGPHYTVTNWYGFYELYLDSGSYSVSVLDDENLRDPLCPASNSYDINLVGNDSIIDSLNFGFQPVIFCADLAVNMSSGFMRPCFTSNYSVKTTNNGTDTAFNSYVEVTLPPEFIVSGGTTPDSQNGSILTFLTGDMPPLSTSSIIIWGTVNCSSILGQTMCAKAKVFPNVQCMPVDSTWDKSSVAVIGRCTIDSSVCFTIYNTGEFGNGDMQGTSDYRIYNNNVLVEQGTFQINGGDSLEICYVAGGNTIRLEADQRPEHPGNSHPNDVIELCGSPNQILGLVNSLPTDDLDPIVDINCTVVSGSYDPNDKRVLPTGISEEFRYIDSLVMLEYKINFQNTGTDTAFNVYLIDTIDDALDPLTIKSLASSHQYNFNFLDTNIVQWYYTDILLPDSNINEAKSHGFIQFSIQQRIGNVVGTIIENSAGIYFDFNDPIITNTTFNTVGIPDTFTTISSLPVIYQEFVEIQVYPNPFSNSTTFDVVGLGSKQVTITLYDLTGKLVKSIIGTNSIQLNRGELTSGIYFYSIMNDNNMIANGKVVIQ